MMILRQSKAISRGSQALLSTRQSCPSCRLPLIAGTRTYARKARRDGEAKVNKKDVSTENTTSSKPAKGLEYIYQSSSLSTPPKKTLENAEPELDDGFIKMTEEQEKMMDKHMKKFLATVPSSLREDVEKAFVDIRKHGYPPGLGEILKKIESGDRLSLSDITRLVRIAGTLARKATERDYKSWEAKQEKKTESGSEFFSFDKDGDKNKKNENKNQKDEYNFKFDATTVIASTLATYMMWKLLGPTETTKEITYQEFQGSLLEKGLVDKLEVINKDKVKIYVLRDAVQRAHPDSPAVNPNFYYYFTIGSVEAFEKRLDEAQDQLQIPTSERIGVAYGTEGSWLGTALSFGPTILTLAFFAWLARSAGSRTGGSGGIFGMGKSRAKKFSHETAVTVKFKDVAGADEAKQEIMEFVSFLKDPGRFEKLGAKIPRGAILSGPPGTGKTLLAKATAGESGVPFFSCSGSEFVEIFVGVGPSRVRDLFAQARKNTPCIIFIDEIDAIGKSRSKGNFGGGNDEREATLNQILTEMDGFNTTDQVVVLAGTNRPDVLDAALMRPGRFDRHIAIDRPTLAGRKQIFGVYLPKIKTEENIDFLAGRLAALTPGFSGADIANCCNEAALIAARLAADQVMMTHFEQAIERTVAGLEKKSLVLNPEERKVVAYHEAGHAICGWFFKWADPLLKVSIIPRGQGALGYAMTVPADTHLLNVNQMMDRMAMTLGGRVSEELHFETVTSGASDDFNKVTRIATMMVTKFGMSEKIGYLFYDDDDNKLHKPFSEETSRSIDLEVRRIITEAYEQCKTLLTEKKKEIGLVAEELLKKEMLDRDDMIRLLGKRPWEDNKEFDKYFGQRPDQPPPGAAAPSLPSDGAQPTIPGLPLNPDTPGTGAAVAFKSNN